MVDLKRLVSPQIIETKPKKFLIGLLSLVLGILGQLMLQGNFLPGAILAYILAVAAMVYACGDLAGPQVPLSEEKQEFPWEDARWGYATGAAAVLCALAAFWTFIASEDTLLPWLIFLAGIALFATSITLIQRAKGEGLLSGISIDKLEIGGLILILAIAGFMRLFRFSLVPFGTWFDEADLGLNALRILNHPGYFPAFVPETELPAHFIYLVALSFKIFGVSTLAVRAVSVVFGIATAAAGYFVGKELFNRPTGFAFAFLLAVSRWDINWSRIGMHGASTPFFELLTIGFLLRGLRRNNLIDYGLAGLSAGLAVGFYFSLRIFPVVILLALIVLFFNKKKVFRNSTWGLGVFVLGMLVASVPVTQYAVSHPEDFWNRTSNVSIFNNKTISEGLSAAIGTTRDHLLMFNYLGDRNGRHNLPGAPMLDPITGALFVLGVGLSLRRIRQPGSFLLVVWLVIMLAPGIFSLEFESPQTNRAFGALPAVYLLAVVPFASLYAFWKSFEVHYQAISVVMPLLAVGGLVGYLNYHTYFDLQATSFDSWVSYSTPETITGNILAGVGNRAETYVSTFYYQAPTVQFLAPNVPSYHRLETYDSFPFPLDGSKSALFIVDAEQQPFYLQAKQYYPGATFKEYRSPDGRPVIYEIYLQPEDIREAQGLTANYYKGEDWSGQPFAVQKETSLSFDWKDKYPDMAPFSVEWTGLLNAQIYGQYHLAFDSTNPVVMEIDSVNVPLKSNGTQSADITLAKGTHAIKIRATAGQGHFQFDWQPPGGLAAPVPAFALYSTPVMANGLLGTYYPNGNWGGVPALKEVNPWIHIYFHNPPLTRPYTVEWEGKIAVPKAGEYTFRLESIDESTLLIDGVQLIDDRIPNQPQDKKVNLQPGLHSIEILFADRTSATHINLFWIPPGGKAEVVPQSVLFPPEGDAQLLTPLGKVGIPTSNLNPNFVAELTSQMLPMLTPKLKWESGNCGSQTGQFKSPHGLAVDPQGNIWVADSGNQRIVELNPDGKAIKTLTGNAANGLPLIYPSDLVIDREGYITVLDPNGLVPLLKYSPFGSLLTSFGSDLNTYHPRGISPSKEGGLYLADTGGSRVLLLDQGGSLLKQFMISDDGKAAGQPVGVTEGPDGSLYAIDANVGALWKFSPDGSSIHWQVISRSDTTDGPDVAVSGSLVFVSDPAQQRILLYKTDGHPVGQITGEANPQNLFIRPVGIAIGSDQTLYVSDSELCHVMALQLPGDLAQP